MNYERLQQPLVLVIFGITGDLSQRKLLPALYQLAKAGELPERLQIVGISRRDATKDDVFGRQREFIADDAYDQNIEQQLKDRTEMRQMDLLDSAAYQALLAHLRELETGFGGDTSRLYYLSIPSQAFMPIIRLLGETGHSAAAPELNDLPRLLIEKPFGYDLPSAQELISVLAEHFSEEQVYRIDHYVAKETVQNILTFRFKNPLFDSVWDGRHIDHIEVLAHEKIGIEGRAQFYEQTGALRDFVQNHLLQLLAITTMARPATLTSADIHAEKLRLLQAVQPIAPDQVAVATVRGQYDGYRAEVNNPDSLIETFACVRLQIANDQWSGVPVTLETGKALNQKLTEIRVCFREPGALPPGPDNGPAAAAGASAADGGTPGAVGGPAGDQEQNRLTFRIQPREGITLRLQTKRPGIRNVTESADMDFDYVRAFGEQQPDEAYERVIVDAIRGDQTLFASSAEVIRSWEIVEHVLEQWTRSADGLLPYAKGSTGPAADAAVALPGAR